MYRWSRPGRWDSDQTDDRSNGHPVRAGRAARADRRRLPLPCRWAGTDRGHRLRHPHPRHDRTGPVHPGGRARDAPRLRLRPARPGLRAEQPGTCRLLADLHPGRPAAVAGRRHGHLLAGGRQRGWHPADHAHLRRACHRHPGDRDLPPGRCRVNGIGSVPPQECGTDLRRAQVRAQRRGGIDAVEPSDDGRTLSVTFLGKAPEGLGAANVRVDGGRRITGITVTGVEIDRNDDPELDDLMTVTVDRAGDSSTYTLCVVDTDPYGRPGGQPYPGFDPRYACAGFTFRAACPTDDDCAAAVACPPTPPERTVVDYTAKDYDSFRRLLLDRMTLIMPDWTERHVPDLEITLAEVLAYVGDQLSYQQDAVAAEAYLDTARRRVSVRRHARLVDYAMHDGCNARAFVTVAVSREATLQGGTYRFLALDTSQLPPQDRLQLGTVMSDEQLEHLPTDVSYE